MRKAPEESHRDMYIDQKMNPCSLIRTIAVRLKGHLILQALLINSKGPSRMQMVWLSYLDLYCSEKHRIHLFLCHGYNVSMSTAESATFFPGDYHEIFSTVILYLPLI